MTPSAGQTEALATKDEADFERKLKELVERSELVDLRTTKFHGELLVEDPADVGEIDLRVSGAFRIRRTGLDVRFEVEAPVSAEDGSDLASVELAVVATFTLDSEERPDKELVSAFMDRVAFFVVMPFIREGLQLLSSRLGLGPITLGLLQQGKPTPITAWISKQGAKPSHRESDQ